MTQTTMQDIWDEVLKHFEDELNPRIFSIWFSPLKYKDFKENVLTIEAPNSFSRDWLMENYHDNIIKEIAQRGHPHISLQCVINADTPVPEPAAEAPALTEHFRSTDIKLNHQYTFENFVIGPSNQFAHAACVAIAQSPAKAYNPLFIYGGVGLGKTHLMQAIGHYIIQKNRAAKILYVSSEKFTHQLIDAIQKRSTTAFREQYRNSDVLLVDDIQFIAGKESTQEEFFHTFNTLHDAHKQIVITSDRPPGEITNLEKRLISRFEWGLIADIQPPDYETRLAIVRKKAALSKIHVPDEILAFIAEHIKSNIRQLEGALIRVIAYASLMEVSFTLDIAKKILHDYIKEHQSKVSIDLLQKKVAEVFNIDPHEMKTKIRTKQIAFCRQIAMYLAHTMTSLSLPEIGNAFGGRDHTTVIHACEKIKEEIKKSQELAKKIEFIQKNICG